MEIILEEERELGNKAETWLVRSTRMPMLWEQRDLSENNRRCNQEDD